MTARSSRITGWGTALPDKILTNADLEGMLDTSDAWIVERSGIRERRIGGSTAGLATDAGRAAMAKARVTDVDLVLVATCSPDQVMPAAACTVQHALGLRCGALDINAACSGFVYGLVVGHQMIAGGMNRVLLIGSETMSRLIDWDDRTTAVLFGDGAGAVVLEATEGGGGGLLGYDLGSDGSVRHILEADIGGFIRMEGREVFRRAVRVMIDSSRTAMAMAGVDADQIALCVPHQANVRIIESALGKIGIPMERTAMVLERTGNTSAASVPLALADAVDAGRLSPGDLVLLTGFGAGMTWASAVIRWSP
ncbi:MAG: beta-ketoacyl-ACP synthase III [Acidimicrobiales bacterium]